MSSVMRVLRQLVAGLLVGAVVSSASAFSLLGPLKTWQVVGIGYGFGDDIGGPMGLTEGYRWNVPVITYSFDEAFIKYFGSNGIAAIDAAFKIINDLPEASKINLDDYPLDAKLVNFQAQAAGVLDLKSAALVTILEELGLAAPERYVWTLRGRATFTSGGVTITNYSVIKLNFDPYTLQPTNVVNGVPYGYTIREPLGVQNYADALETLRVTSDKIPFSSVASGLSAGYSVTTNNLFFTGGALSAGEFYFGLTRDDVGGLRFLMHPNNFAVEGTLPTVGLASGVSSSGWIPWFGLTNIVTTNVVTGTNATNFIVTGLRGGVNKIKFQRVFFDAVLGQNFTPITNRFNDRVVATNRLVTQRLQRAILQPDIVFSAGDLGLAANGVTPVLMGRSDTTTWINNDAINGVSAQGGPGVIVGPVIISFSNVLPYFVNQTPFLLDEQSAFGGFVWGSFDHTTDPPIIYPQFLNLTLDDLLDYASGRRPLANGRRP